MAWTRQATINPTEQNRSFGEAISVNGNSLVVGAPKTDCIAGLGCGAIYVYIRSGDTWTIQQKITAQTTGGADDSQPGAEFGTSVSLDGNTLIVGASLKSCAVGADCGAAYVYTRTGTTWTIQQKLTAQILPGVDDLQADAWFGEAVAISGNTALVGASHYDCVGLNDCGAAYMYVRSGSLWTLQQKLIARDTFGASDEGSWTNFGRAVALQGNTAVIGSPYALSCLLPDERCGAAYLYARSGTIWSIQQKITAKNTDGTDDRHAYDYFGAAVGMDGSTLLVGAPYVGGEGAAYAYVLSPGSTLSVSKSGPGGDGSIITSNPAGITCGTACQANYVNGTSVTLNPSNPGDGYAFAGWSGACSGTDPCTITLNSDLSVAARYAALTTTTLSANPANSIFGQSIDLSAVVSGASPQGAVNFKDGVISLGSSPLTGATATLSTSGLLAGNHSLTAVYEGDDNNAGSVSNAVNFNVAKAPQAAVSINAPASARYQESGLAVFGYGGSGTGAFTYSTAGSTACTVHPTSGALTITSGSGLCQVTATRLADNNYQEASSAAAIIQVNKAPQAALTVSATPASLVSGGAGSTLSSVGGSTGGAVTYAATASPGLTCTISGSTLTASGGAGTCSVTASMAGNQNYEPVTSAALAVPVVLETGPSGLFSAVLPYARSVPIGQPATAFGTLINATGVDAIGCALALPVSPAIPATFNYQTTNASNQLVGTPNTPVNIPAWGSQSFIFGITPGAAFAATDIPIVFDCANTLRAPSQVGLNTFLLSASSTPVPDMVAIGATPSGDGVLRLPGSNGVHAFATAAVNIGGAGEVTATVDTGGVPLPLALTVCQTHPVTGACVFPPAASTTRTLATNASATYAVFAQASGAIPLDPAGKRIFLRLSSGGVVRGATSVAVSTE